MRFRGTFDHSLDAKNRLTVPARFRASLADGLVLSQGIESCLQIWVPAAFDAFVDDALASAPRLSVRHRELTRFFSANSVETELDSAGRIGVPKEMLAYAGLTKDCKLVGASDCLEIWDATAWTGYNQELTTNVGDISALFET